MTAPGTWSSFNLRDCIVTISSCNPTLFLNTGVAAWSCMQAVFSVLTLDPGAQMQALDCQQHAADFAVMVQCLCQGGEFPSAPTQVITPCKGCSIHRLVDSMHITADAALLL